MNLIHQINLNHLEHFLMHDCALNQDKRLDLVDEPHQLVLSILYKGTKQI
jgi:hypothetical protein